MIRKIANKLFFQVLYKSNLSANLITFLNFVVFGLNSVFLIAGKKYLWAVPLCVMFVLIDHVDGEIARARNDVSAFGHWLDEFDDWIWQLLLIAVASFSSGVPIVGVALLITNVSSNMISLKENVHYDLPLFMGIGFCIIIGCLFNCLPITLRVACIVQGFKFIMVVFKVVNKYCFNCPMSCSAHKHE